MAVEKGKSGLNHILRESAAVCIGTAALFHSTDFRFFSADTTKTNIIFVKAYQKGAAVLSAPHFFSARLGNERRLPCRCRAPPGYSLRKLVSACAEGEK